MNINIHIHHHSDERTEILLHKVNQIQEKLELMSEQEDQLAQAQADEAASIAALRAGVEAFIAAHPESNLQSFIDAAVANKAAVEAIDAVVEPAPPADPPVEPAS